MPSSKNHVSLTVVANSTEVSVDANLHQPMRAVAERALAQSHNTGRPLSEWTLTDASGNAVDLSRSVESYGFQEGAVLFLSLAAGANG